ncbi:MAG: prolipoprotein diacylglyceryl transferase [Anaerolineales bacterium]|nr:prolipoprotein diacylglyceryl transferase [Anaerolineales bacterium]
MFPILQIGPLALQTPGLFLILGLWLGLSLAERLSPRFNYDPRILYNIVFIALIAGVIGARVFYAARYFDVFINAPLNLISLNPGLLDPLGGFATGFIAVLIYANRNNVHFWPTLDALTPLLAVAAIAVGLSQWASGDAFGQQTDLPWGIYLWGAKRHPTQIYSTLAAVFALGIIWPRSQGVLKISKTEGTTFLRFTAVSAAARLFLEAFRGNSLIFIANLRAAQIAAWAILALSFWGLQRLKTINRDN